MTSKILALALCAFPLIAWSQAPKAPSSIQPQLPQTAKPEPDFDPFAMQLLSRKDMEKMAQQPVLPVAVSPAPPTAKIPEPQSPPDVKALPNPAPPSQTAASIAPPAAEPPPPRYVPDQQVNTGTLNYYLSRGANQASSNANAYGQRQAPPAPAGSNRAQMNTLEAILEQVRAKGVNEGKISVELNRLTTAQFIHWAQQTGR